MTGAWTVEDAKILKKLAWRICYATTVKHETRLAVRIAHWPRRVFVPSQLWIASLNT